MSPQTTDRSTTIEWPVPPEHKVNKLEADQIVEAYKATAIESGVGTGGEDFNKKAELNV